MRAVTIFTFVPNLIGYTRIALSLASFFLAKDYPLLFIIFYSASFILDAADGMAARALGQCSNMGVILDMLTDRASTAGMLVILDGVLQPVPHYVTFILASLVFLDVASHFCRMYATLFVKKDNHKDVSDSIFPLLRLYYSNRKFMGLLCIGQEFSYICLFAWSAFRQNEQLATPLLYTAVALSVPCALKQVANLEQLIDGLYHIAEVDAATRTQQEANKSK
eukprot:gene4004-2859_t